MDGDLIKDINPHTLNKRILSVSIAPEDKFLVEIFPSKNLKENFSASKGWINMSIINNKMLLRVIYLKEVLYEEYQPIYKKLKIFLS